MVMPDRRASRATSFAISFLALVVIVAMLTGLLLWLLNSAGGHNGAEPPDKEHQKVLTQMAAVVMAVLVIAVLVLLYLVARYVARRVLTTPDKPPPTPFVSAWVEAGRRLRPEDAPPVPDFEDAEETDDPDGQDGQDGDDEYPGADGKS